MFVRKKKNPSGLVSVQVIDKSSGKYKLIRTIGSSDNDQQIEALLHQGQQFINTYGGQRELTFDLSKEEELAEMFFSGIRQVSLAGPELLLGKIFDEIGFNQIPDELFRHLVITRLCFPVSKLKTVDYLYQYQGIVVRVDSIYRYLDTLYNKHKPLVQQLGFAHTQRVLKQKPGVVFYDVTTLYFETDQQDELRRTGFSKEGKHQHPQIVLGLLVSTDGYPLAYEVFEGNKYEGHTMLPVIEGFKTAYKLDKLVIVADAGLLTGKNIEELTEKQYEFILGARIKSESKAVKEKILATRLNNGESAELARQGLRLIYSYSESRAKKDRFNRQRGLEKLEKASRTGKLSKKNINNRGYNKYLEIKGKADISINYQKIGQDAAWDGLKGYITNTSLSKNQVISQYGNLWKIGRAFRIAKTDLKIRPVYHRLRQRIEAHICVAFAAYKVYKELERQLKIKMPDMSAEKAIELVNTIFKITIELPYSKKKKSKLHFTVPLQQKLLETFQI